MQPHIYSAFFLSLVALLSGFCAAQPCQPPFSLELSLESCDILSGNSSISDIHSWGIRISISGADEICVAPSTVVNSTFLTSQSICDQNQLIDINELKMSPEQCRSRRGGWITTSKLPPANIAGLSDLNEGWGPLGNTIENAVTASLQFDDTSVTMIEGTIDGGQMSTQSHLGLASDSTLLKTLKDSGAIGSRSWGLNSGSQSAKSPRPGRLILGGYDSASRVGPFYDYPVLNTLQGKRYCPLQVPITSLIVTIQKGNDSGKSLPLVEESHPLVVCIEPYDNLFRMPQQEANDIRDLIKDVTKYAGDPILPAAYQDILLNLEPGIVYPKSAGEFNMTMRITINNELTVQVPHYELQRPLRGLDKDGKVVSNDAYNELQIYGDNPAENSPVIGKAVLSQLYLFVDYETMMFHLALQNTNANTPVSVSSNSCPPTNDGLSATAKGLIGVGAVLGALLLLLALFGYWFYKKFWRRSPPDLAMPKTPKPASLVVSPSPARSGTEVGAPPTETFPGTGQDGPGGPGSRILQPTQPTLPGLNTGNNGLQETGAGSPVVSETTTQPFSVKGERPGHYK